MAARFRLRLIEDRSDEKNAVLYAAVAPPDDGSGITVWTWAGALTVRRSWLADALPDLTDDTPVEVQLMERGKEKK